MMNRAVLRGVEMSSAPFQWTRVSMASGGMRILTTAIRSFSFRSPNASFSSAVCGWHDRQAGDDGVDEQSAGGLGLVVGQRLGLERVQQEAGRDEQEDAGPKQEAALALQAGLAQQVFEGAVGHSVSAIGVSHNFYSLSPVL